MPSGLVSGSTSIPPSRESRGSDSVEPRKFASVPRRELLAPVPPDATLTAEGCAVLSGRSRWQGSRVTVRFARYQAGRECSLRIAARTDQSERIWENWPAYGVSQSTKRRLGILWKSEVFWVTSVKSKTNATEAINKSAVGTSIPLRRS